MNRFVSILIFCVLGLSGLSQEDDHNGQGHTAQSSTDAELLNLIETLPTLSEDSGKVRVLLQIQELTMKSEPARSLNFGQQALRMAREMRLHKMEAQCYFMLGIANRSLEQFEQAGEHYRKAEHLFDSLGDKQILSDAHLKHGVVYFYQGKYKEALEQYYEALTLREEINDPERIASALNNIGTTYQVMGRDEDALAYLERSLEYTEKLGHQQGMAFLLNNLGILYLKQDDSYTALKNFRAAYKVNAEIARKTGDFASRKAMANNLKNIGMIYEALGVYLKALEYNFDALKIETELGDRSAIAGTYNNIGKIYASLDNSKDAKSYFDMGLAIGQEIGSPEVLKSAYQGLASVYEHQQNFEQAYFCYKAYRLMEDSLQSMALEEEVNRLRIAYEMERKEKDLEQLKAAQAEDTLALLEREASIDQQRTIITVSVIGGILLLLLVVLLFSRNQLRKRANERLKEEIRDRKSAEQQLKDANSELNTLMYKSSHDLKSPLASAIGLTNVAKMEVTDEGARKYIDMINDRMVYLDGMLTNLITTSQLRQGQLNLREIDFESLIGAIIKSVDRMPGFNSLSIEVEVRMRKPFFGDTSVLTTIIQNVITNAVKYQDAEKQERFCRISVLDNADGVRIKIADNGIGIEQEVKDKAFEMFSRGSSDTEGSGLGLYIVLTSVRKLGGHLALESEEKEGTSIVMDLPDLRPQEEK